MPSGGSFLDRETYLYRLGTVDSAAEVESGYSRVRRSLHSAYDTWRRELSAHSDTVGTHGGVYLGTFFCMNGACPGRTRITDRGRSLSSAMIRPATASR